jgi:hypothetical protein
MNEQFIKHIERQSAKRNVCKTYRNGNQRPHRLEYERPDTSDQLLVEVSSNGETVIIISERGRNATLVISNRAAHELRDFLKQRFPNATEAQ